MYGARYWRVRDNNSNWNNTFINSVQQLLYHTTSNQDSLLSPRWQSNSHQKHQRTPPHTHLSRGDEITLRGASERQWLLGYHHHLGTGWVDVSRSDSSRATARLDSGSTGGHCWAVWIVPLKNTGKVQIQEVCLVSRSYYHWAYKKISIIFCSQTAFRKQRLPYFDAGVSSCGDRMSVAATCSFNFWEVHVCTSETGFSVTAMSIVWMHTPTKNTKITSAEWNAN